MHSLVERPFYVGVSFFVLSVGCNDEVAYERQHLLKPMLP